MKSSHDKNLETLVIRRFLNSPSSDFDVKMPRFA